MVHLRESGDGVPICMHRPGVIYRALMKIDTTYVSIQRLFFSHFFNTFRLFLSFALELITNRRQSGNWFKSAGDSRRNGKPERYERWILIIIMTRIGKSDDKSPTSMIFLKRANFF